MLKQVLLKVLNFGGDWDSKDLPSELIYEIDAWNEVNYLIAEDAFKVSARGSSPLIRGLRWL